MLKKLSLAKKLYLGFGTILILLTVLAVVVFNNLVNIKDRAGDAIDYSHYDTFMVEAEAAHLKWLNKLTGLFLHNEEKVDVQLDHTKCFLGKFLYGEKAKELAAKDPEIKALLEKIKDPHQKFHESAGHIGKVWKQRHLGLRNLLKDQMNEQHIWASEVSKIVIEKNSNIKIQTDSTKSHFGKFLRSTKLQEFIKISPKIGLIVEKVKGPYESLYVSVRNVIKAVKAREYKKAEDIYTHTSLPLMDTVEKIIHEMIDFETTLTSAQAKAEEIFQNETLVDLGLMQNEFSKIREHLSEKSDDAKDVLYHTVDTSEVMISILSVVAIVLGIFISIFLALSISRAISRIVENLKTGSEQVSSASGQVSQSSQSMAEGASEQASSLEEISSSLEEMSSMTKQNADNVKQANSMAKDTKDEAEKGKESMQKMSDAIEKIKNSSDETAKIIKTIDEIAFQTNLLALNAAVEAARAGEAGKGFAVVAEEVRNLAQRSAEAAKNTAGLIEDAQNNSQNGVNMTKEVDEGLRSIVDSVQKVSGLIEEVSAATNEQAQGMEQINVAISQIDTVTQSNSASAEESAAASEELSGQASELQDMVVSLVEIVQGASEKTERKLTTGSSKYANLNNVKQLKPKTNNVFDAGNFSHPVAVNDSAGVVKDNKKEEIIPLDDGELKKF
ncbi:MAG: CZB domain-containing protein [Bacteriovoracaceae bacterium]|nr:CZB domain-containing protein [Bacteriovoracaceae bacterium]